MSNSGPDYLESIAHHMGYSAPYLLAYVIGIVVVFLHRRRCPRAAAFALAALTAMFLIGFFGSALQGYLLADLQFSSGSFWLVSLVGWVRGLLDLVALGLLVAAVFVGRAPAPPAED